MANVFDQFDSGGGGNVFDQFDGGAKNTEAAPTKKRTIDDLVPGLESGGFQPVRGAAEAIGSTAMGVPAYAAGIAAGSGAMLTHVLGKLFPSIQNLPGYEKMGQPEDIREEVTRSLMPEPGTPTGRALYEYNPAALVGKGVGKIAEAVKAPKESYQLDPWSVVRNAIAEGIRQAPGVAGAVLAGKTPRPRVEPMPDPLAAERTAKMESLPVPIEQATKGQLTRDPVQLRVEGQLGTTEAGAPLRDVYVSQNERLIQNLDTLRGRAAPKSASESDVGRRVAGEAQPGRPGAEGALTRQMMESERNIARLYRQAEIAGETQGRVPTKNLVNYLATHEDPSMVGYATNKLKQLKLIQEDEFGNIIEAKPEGKMSGVASLAELEGIRRAAVAAEKDGGTKGHYARELKRVIDQTTAGAGGEAYQAARRARYEHAQRFEEPRAVDRLLAEKSRTDRMTALEDVWNTTVLKGSIADLERVRDTLLNTADRRTRDSGRKAWRDIAGQTVDYIKQEATKSATTDEAGRPNLSPAALKKTLDRIGDEKLRVILGDTASKQLRDIAEVASDLKTKPPTRISGSDTNANLLMMMNKALDRIPILGSFGRGAVRLTAKAVREGRSGREVERALQPPTVGGYAPNPALNPTLWAMQMLTAQGQATRPEQE